MLALALALLSSIAYGAADFAGGLAARRANVLLVVAVGAPASLVAEVALLPLLGATWSIPALAWGALSGVGSVAAFLLLYRTLAIGPMSVLSPVAALTSAGFPVAVGFGLGERLTAPAVGGVLLGLVAILMVSYSREEAATRVRVGAVLLALGAGGAIALQVICLDQAPAGSGLAPVLAGRVVSSLLVLVAFAAAGRARREGRGGYRLGLAAGLLDGLATVALLAALRSAELGIVAVIVAMYPVATILLARVLLRERLSGLQGLGLVTAGAAVVTLVLA